jgi:iron complex transport system substrate-binding protein
MNQFDPMSVVMNRRRLLLTALGGVAAVGLAACGSSDDAGTTGAAAGGDATTAAAATEPAATTAAATTATAPTYPITIQHVHGETVIPAAPERVVSYGYTDQDPLLALGVVPVGILQWIPEWKQGVGAWSTAALGGATPALYSGTEIDFEGISKAEPDLIMAVNNDIKKADYDKLSKIAPTVLTPAGYPSFGTPWDVATGQVGAALGKSAEAAALIATAKKGFTDAAAAHPEWAGKQVMMVGPDAGGKIYLFADTDTRGRFVASLGFKQSPEVSELVGKEFFASISPERFDLLDGDGLIVFQETAAAKAQMKEMPSFQALDVVKNGHVVPIDDLELAMALSASSVTSIPYALERVVPELEKALSA